MHVTAFVVDLCPAPPVSTRTALDCLAKDTLPYGDSYLQHSPRLGHLNHLSDPTGTGHHSGRPSPSPVRGTLRTSVHVAGPIPVCPRLPPWHSFRPLLSDFWEQNLEAPPYPSGKVFLTRFGTVSAYAYRQGPYAPFMVELFATGFFSPAPSIVICPVACVTARRLPTAAKVERAEYPFVPNPLEGLAHPVGFTRLSTPAGPNRPSLSRSPRFNSLYGIEAAD